LKLVPLSLAEHAVSWEVFRGPGRVPPLVVEFSERASGDVDVLRKPLILNPAGTEGQILINALRGTCSDGFRLPRPANPSQSIVVVSACCCKERRQIDPSRVENSVPRYFHNLWRSKIARLAICMGECSASGFVTLSSGEERSADGCTASYCCGCELARMHR
jgi:hypothetical protein